MTASCNTQTPGSATHQVQLQQCKSSCLQPLLPTHDLERAAAAGRYSAPVSSGYVRVMR
jgi:hypothetical protein